MMASIRKTAESQVGIKDDPPGGYVVLAHDTFHKQHCRTISNRCRWLSHHHHRRAKHQAKLHIVKRMECQLYSILTFCIAKPGETSREVFSLALKSAVGGRLARNQSVPRPLPHLDQVALQSPGIRQLASLDYIPSI